TLHRATQRQVFYRQGRAIGIDDAEHRIPGNPIHQWRLSENVARGSVREHNLAISVSDGNAFRQHIENLLQPVTFTRHLRGELFDLLTSTNLVSLIHRMYQDTHHLMPCIAHWLERKAQVA